MLRISSRLNKKAEEDETKQYAFFDYDHLEETNVWYLNDPERKQYLIENMKPEQLENTIFGIVLDFTRPWAFLDQLAIWADVIFEINKQLFLKLPVQKQNKMRRDIENHFKFYQNPEKVDTEVKEGENQEGEGDEDEMREAIHDMDLDEGVLNVNLGVPIIIICSKSEVVATGESQGYFQPRFDFIQKNLREFALRYGASIIFTSAKKKGTNMETLYQYLQHRFFDAEFKVGPETNNREGLFIPSGFDSPNIVAQLCPNIDDPYDKIVNNVAGLDDDEEKEVEWEDWDKWLESMKSTFTIPEDDEKLSTAKKDKPDQNPEDKKVNTKDFFQNLIKKNKSNRESVKTKEGDGEQAKPDKFSKLRLDNVE